MNLNPLLLRLDLCGEGTNLLSIFFPSDLKATNGLVSIVFRERMQVCMSMFPWFKDNIFIKDLYIFFVGVYLISVSNSNYKRPLSNLIKILKFGKQRTLYVGGELFLVGVCGCLYSWLRAKKAPKLGKQCIWCFFFSGGWIWNVYIVYHA